LSWEDVGFVKASRIRLQILEIMDKPMTPTELAKSLKVPKYRLPAISRALKELDERKMVSCLNPRQKKGRLYQRSQHGISVLKMLKGAQEV